MKAFLVSFFIIVWLVFPGYSQQITSVGTDFWIAFPPGGSTDIYIYISSNYSTSGSISSDYPGVDQNFTVTPGVITQLTLPLGVMLLGGIENKGIRITSADPISVYGLNYDIASSDAFLALPVNALGTDYNILTYTEDWMNQGCCFAVVATQDGTTLTIFNHQTNSIFTVNLDMGQTYFLCVTNYGEDLTGSRIQSNYPVAIFGSVTSVQIPPGCSYGGGHIVEELFPHYSWGKYFVTMPLAGRDTSGDIFRVLAAEDTTEVRINGNLVTSLNTGDHYEINLSGYNSVTTSKAALLAQYAKCMGSSGGTTGDVSMMLIPPLEQFLTNYTVQNFSGFATNWINVVAPCYALGTIYQDSVLIPVSAFIQIPNTNFYGAQRSVYATSHTLYSPYPFGVFVYGWDPQDNAYSYPGGCSLTPKGIIDSIILSPDTAYGELNITNICLIAHVKDNLSNPVEGVSVDFHISGINPLTGNAVTDPSGNAQYCYTQTGTTPGIDHVYADFSCFTSDTSIVIWSYTPPCNNPKNGGSIGNDQSGCGSYTPLTLNNIAFPTGQTGTLEYKWQQSITGSSSGFTDIAGSNAASYNPVAVNQTTWYKRLARVDCMPDWTRAVESNVLEMIVIPPLPVALTISASDNNVCGGTYVTLIATPTNEGSAPGFQWKVNGMDVGTNTPSYSYVPVNGDIVTCILTSSEPCTTNNPATSNPITMIVYPLLPVSLNIIPSENPVCSGIAVIYTANPINEGTTPSYQWKVNGINVGTNNPLYSYVPLNGDNVTCALNSNVLCPTGNPAISNAVTMTVNPNLTVSVSISASANPFCQGSFVAFTATSVNEGTTPLYQWKVNAINAGTSSPTFIYNPVNGDQVTCSLTSSLPCTQSNPASSNTITMIINANLPAGVLIIANPNPFCPGTTVNYTATPVNGGTAPSYQWKVNGTNQGTNSPNYSYAPQAGDSIRCIITSNLSCVTNNPALSNKIVMSTLPVPLVMFNLCFDSITTITAAPFILKGGIPLGGTYSGPGVSSGTGVFTPSVAGVGTKTITYSYTNVSSCTALMTKTIIVQAAPVFSCGNNLTDIRDNKVYSTVQLGTQCWMQKNLNYGTSLQGATEQTDNCINEKYCYNDNAANCTLYGGLYQWDELMAYSNTPGTQGLCPPGWHIPTQTDWNTLFTFYQQQALAGKPLQDTIIMGFRAKESGVIYSNFSWSFKGFATIFWTSTSSGTIKAISHGMNLINFSVSDYPANRSNAFAVRCLKN